MMTASPEQSEYSVGFGFADVQFFDYAEYNAFL